MERYSGGMDLWRTNMIWIAGLAVLWLPIIIECSVTEGPPERLKISTIVDTPYLMYYNSSRKSGNEQFYGFIPDLLEALCHRGAMSCDYDIHLVKDGQYGWRYGGLWNGIIGEVFDREADIGAAPLIVSSFRKQAVSFTEPITNNSIALLIRKGWPIESREDLSILSPTWPGFHFGTLEDGWTKNAFAIARDVVGTTLFRQMKYFVKTEEEGVQKTRTENYTFIGSRDMLEYYANYYCDLEIRDDFYDTDPSGFVVRNGSPLLETLDRTLKELKADGTFWKLRSKWWKPECTFSDSGAPKYNCCGMQYYLVPFLLITVSRWWLLHRISH